MAVSTVLALTASLGALAAPTQIVAPPTGIAPGAKVLPGRAPSEQPRIGPAPIAHHRGWPDELHPTVELGTGAFHLSRTDLTLPGRGFDFVWALRYRSLDTTDGRMGPGWTDSYDVTVEQVPEGLQFSNGVGRRDLYRPEAGKWVNPEFSVEFSQLPSGRFVATHADLSTWLFLPIDGSPVSGRLERLEDRFGNALVLTYTAGGLLQSITDDRGGVYSFAHDAAGRVISVADFTGRFVTYEYYGPNEPGGAEGQLETITGTPIVGTSNANDYPSGKATTFTYAPAQNGVAGPLVSVIDAKGRTNLVNTYDRARRVVRQQYGAVGQVTCFHYELLIPGPGDTAALRTVMTDPVGNVVEARFDVERRLLRERKFTGRWAPGVPTPSPVNPPTPKLRVSDPPYFQTTRTYDADVWLPRVIVYPDGNSVVLEYDPLAPTTLARANLRRQTQYPGPIPSDQSSLVDEYEYIPGTGGCCGSSFLSRHIDPSGRSVVNEYDALLRRVKTIERIATVVTDRTFNAAGQLTSVMDPPDGNGQRRLTTYDYYSSGPQQDRLRERVVDPGGLALTTGYEYDQRGYLVRKIDANGNDELYEVNALGQMIQKSSAQVATLGGSVRYLQRYFWDATDNLARTDIQNVDETGAVAPNAWLTDVRDFNVVDRVVGRCRECGSYDVPLSQLTCAGLPPQEFIEERMTYDNNHDLVLTRYGEDVSGGQVGNSVLRRWDERRKLLDIVEAPGTPERKTTRFHWIGNEGTLLERKRVGTELLPRVTVFTYDGFQRRKTATDPMGNVSAWTYDSNGNIVIERLDGELVDVDNSAGNVRLAETRYAYDAMNRRLRTERAFFDRATQAPLQGSQQLGWSIQTSVWSDASQILSVTDDGGDTIQYRYDRAHRGTGTVDPAGNTVDRVLDDNGNVIAEVSTDVDGTGGPDQVFVVTHFYDALDRRTATVDGIGNTNAVAYDSRGNAVLRIDPRGIEERNVFDGVNRHREWIRDYNGGGANAADSSDILEVRTYDRSMRLVSSTDDNGRTTSFSYNRRNERVVTQFADGTTEMLVLDVHGNAVQSSDGNGTTFSNTFDLNNRLVGRSVTNFGPGVDQGITFEAFTYDGRSNLRSGTDDGSAVTFVHDSLDRSRSESLNGRTTQLLRNGEGLPTQVTYPGGHVVSTTYDALDRPASLTSGVLNSDDFFYVGRRLARIDRFNGVTTTLRWNGIQGLPNAPGDLGFQQIAETLHVNAAAEVIDQRQYFYDAAQNKTQMADLRPTGPMRRRLHTYDLRDQLARTDITTSGGTVLQTEDYQYDGVYNRTNTVGGTNPGPYTIDAVNNYTTAPGATITSDLAGSRTSLTDNTGLTLYKWNARRQLAEVIDAAGKQHLYRYDALGRRIERIVDAAGPSPQTTRYVYLDAYVLEERDATDALKSVIVSPRAGSNVPGMPAYLSTLVGSQLYAIHAESVGSIVVVTGGLGIVQERYSYTDYGERLIMDPQGLPLPRSLVANDIGFRSFRHDASMCLVLGYSTSGRAAYLDAQLGRLLHRRDSSSDGRHCGVRAINGAELLFGMALLENAPAQSTVSSVAQIGPLITLGIFLLTCAGNTLACSLASTRTAQQCLNQTCPDGYRASQAACFTQLAFDNAACNISCGSQKPTSGVAHACVVDEPTPDPPQGGPVGAVPSEPPFSVDDIKFRDCLWVPTEMDLPDSWGYDETNTDSEDGTLTVSDGGSVTVYKCIDVSLIGND